jgi:hypothetical protein
MLAPFHKTLMVPGSKQLARSLKRISKPPPAVLDRTDMADWHHAESKIPIQSSARLIMPLQTRSTLLGRRAGWI